MTVSVNVTVNMAPEMLADIDEEKDAQDMSRAEYIRHCIRQADDSPFEVPASVSTQRTNETESKEGTA